MKGAHVLHPITEWQPFSGTKFQSWRSMSPALGWPSLCFLINLDAMFLLQTFLPFFPSPLFSFCCCSIAQSCPTLCGCMDCSMLVFHYLQELAQPHVHWVGDAPYHHLIHCHSLFLLPSIFPSLRVFSNESALHNRWPQYWSSSLSISPSNEYSGLISFRIDWFDLLAAQRTLKSLLQHHSPKAAIFGALPSLWFNCHIHTWLLEKP